MSMSDNQCLTIEIAPQQVIEVACEVRAIPAGDLAALQNVRTQVQQSASDARISAQAADASAQVASEQSQLANHCRMQAEGSAQRALASSIDAREDADMAGSSAKLAEDVLDEVTAMHSDVEQAWGSIDHATLVSISADLIRTQAMMVQFHGFQ